MYSESDLQAAVDAKVLTPEAAAAFRSHIASARSAPGADEEHFRLITGFNDIFVSIAAVILLVAVAWIGESIHKALAGAIVAASARFLAEYFTRKRRIALPSIVLMLAFAGGVAATMIGFLVEHGEAMFGNDPSDVVGTLLVGGIALVTAGATWLHWRRFMVPITVAAGTAALAAMAVALILSITGIPHDSQTLVMALALVAGIGVFTLAMWWDRSDRIRQTRRSDVAFWLHLLAAPMIAHPIFYLLGVTEGDNISSGAAVMVVGIYVLFGLIALAIDRRALLVSALAYVLFALTQLFQTFGAVELNVALTAFVIGSALLLLSAFWQNARSAVVGLLPDNLANQLPATVRPVSPLPAS
jgi:MFS family permease